MGRKLERRSRDFTDQEVEVCLMAVALSSGNATKAVQLLQRTGQPAPHRATLAVWARDTHGDRYRRIRKEVEPRLNEQMAEVLDDLQREYTAVQFEALAKTRELLPQVTKATDSARIAKDTGIGGGIAQDKGALRRGQPTEIRRTESLQDILKAVHARFPGLWPMSPELLEGEAEEVDDETSKCHVPEAQASDGYGEGRSG